MSLEEKGAEYARWIAKTGLSDATKKLYPARVHQYLAWVAAHYDEHSEALGDPYSRDYAVRDYRRDLMTVDKRAIATVELTMSALGSFYDWLGLGKPDVKRTSPPKGAPKSLEDAELRRVMRAAERRGNRDYALASTLFLTAIRVDEAHQLDTDDVLVSDRSGLLHVRYGKGGESRQVPIPADARAALRPWLAERRDRYGDLGALFISRGGGRLSVRRMQSLMADIGTDAGVHVSPHVLRHTYARNFLEGGGDIASLQEVLGHKNLSSTQVYTKPRAGRLAELAENVRIEL
jgi:integrase/recombinase XerC